MAKPKPVKQLKAAGAPVAPKAMKNPIAAARSKGQRGALMSAANKRRSMSKVAATVGVDKSGQVATTNMRAGSKRRQGSAATKGKQGGINVPKFASEVSGNFRKGVKAMSQGLDKLPAISKSRAASGSVTKATQAAPANRAALKRILGK